jgi:hypothetical protein
MNIFLFDECLKKNAEFFFNIDKKRFNKQIVESTQLMAASMLHHYDITVYKKDGTPYIVNKIVHHPACKWLLKDKKNNYWHLLYLKELLNLSPLHVCNISYNNALKQRSLVVDVCFPLNEYLCITNSDMSGLSKSATVFDKYKRHLENKHRAEGKLN